MKVYVDEMYAPLYMGEEGGRNVRCYCNMPACVMTGYMCKSPAGGCFSELLPDVKRARHGCVEDVTDDPTRDHRAKCMNSPSAGGSSNTALKSSAGSLVLCCFRDLCNHVDNPHSRIRLNDSLAGGGNWSGFSGMVGGGMISGGVGAGAVSAAGNVAGEGGAGDLWFRAATIAVPICGALILFVLIGLAVRILRTDALESANKLSATYTPHASDHGPMEQPLMKKSPMSLPLHHGPITAPLLLSHANATRPYEMSSRDRTLSSGKNEANAKMNLASDSREGSYDAMVQQCLQPNAEQPVPLHKPTNTDPSNRDVNINMPQDEDEKMEDKLYNKETILYWGKAASNTVNHCPQ